MSSLRDQPLRGTQYSKGLRSLCAVCKCPSIIGKRSVPKSSWDKGSVYYEFKPELDRQECVCRCHDSWRMIHGVSLEV
jgi:hypothetical protein